VTVSDEDNDDDDGEDGDESEECDEDHEADVGMSFGDEACHLLYISFNC